MKSCGSARLQFRYAWLHLLLVFMIIGTTPVIVAQSAPQQGSDEWKPGTAVTELQDVTNTANPTRVTETRSQVGGRRIETRVTEARSINGGFAPISETEQETVQVDSNTVHVVQRLFGRDANGNRQLLRVTEEEKTKLSSGGERTVRTSSNSDANGRLQVAGREIQQTTATGPDSKQTETTILVLTPNGFAPVQKNVETEHRKGNVTEVRKSSLGVDVNGRIVPFEEKQSSIVTSNGTRTTNERSTADFGNGMSVVQVTTGKDWKDAQGQQHSDVQTYTPSIPGVTLGKDLYLERQSSTVTRTLPGGTKQTEQQLQQAIPASPRDGLRIQQSVGEVSRPAGTGQSETRKTTQQWNGNQGMQTVTVGDTQHSTVVP